MATLTLIVNGRRTIVEADPETLLLYTSTAVLNRTPRPTESQVKDSLALANAIFDATSVRLQSVPLTPAKLKAARRFA
jgi:hypothetical protein